jgi:hypothetical protein
MQAALDAFEQHGDMSQIKGDIFFNESTRRNIKYFIALMQQNHGRRQSIDLLDGLDLDFLHVRRNSNGFGGSFDGDLFFDDTYDLPPSHPTESFRPAMDNIMTNPYDQMHRGDTGSFGGAFEGAANLVDMSEYDAVATASYQNLQARQGVSIEIII